MPAIMFAVSGRANVTTDFLRVRFKGHQACPGPAGLWSTATESPGAETRIRSRMMGLLNRNIRRGVPASAACDDFAALPLNVFALIRVMRTRRPTRSLVSLMDCRRLSRFMVPRRDKNESCRELVSLIVKKQTGKRAHRLGGRASVSLF